MLSLSALLISLVVSASLTALLVRKSWMPDVANNRSLHVGVVSRAGGVAISAGIASAGVLLSLAGTTLPVLFWCAWTLVLAVSLVDDMCSVPVAGRLVVHLVAATLLLMLVPGMPVLAGAVVLLIAWFTNLFNFMDGMDGLAASMGVVGGCTLAFLAWFGGDPTIAGMGFAAAGASLGFGLFNFPPARIFMGDAGAAGLGFVFAGLAVLGSARGAFQPQCVITVFLPFIVDASITLLERVLRGERPWQAHRDHLYQRLVLAGWTTRKVLWFEWVIMLSCSTAALLSARFEALASEILAGAAIGLAALNVFLKARLKNRT